MTNGTKSSFQSLVMRYSLLSITFRIKAHQLSTLCFSISSRNLGSHYTIIPVIIRRSRTTTRTLQRVTLRYEIEFYLTAARVCGRPFRSRSLWDRSVDSKYNSENCSRDVLRTGSQRQELRHMRSISHPPICNLKITSVTTYVWNKI